MGITDLFPRLARLASRAMGQPITFVFAIGVILLWMLSGPFLGFSDTWQLVINTFTTLVTFLMVFLIQNSQNRDSGAVQIKLDELIRSTAGAHNVLLDLEELSEEDIDRVKRHYEGLAAAARHDLAQGVDDTDRPVVDLEPEMSEAELRQRVEQVFDEKLVTQYEAATSAAREFGERHSRGILTPEHSAVRALKTLIAGNKRFASGRPRHPHQTIERRREQALNQTPIAAILACADSRVAPEIIFDQGIGDLFTIRIAGNFVTDAVFNSLEFAVNVLEVPLIIVVGHQSCGAVLTTLAAITAGQETATHDNALVRAIAPVARRAAGRSGDPVENTVRDNVYLAVDGLQTSDELGGHVADGSLRIAGAYYSITTGEVEFLED